MCNNLKVKGKLSQKFRNFNIQTLSKDQSVYLCLSTSPGRILKLHYVLRSLDLTLIRTIFITLPLRYKGKEKYSIPRQLMREFPQIRILTLEYDIGPMSKLLPQVEYVKMIRGNKADNDIFIVIDDDICYSVAAIDTLVYYSLKNPESAVGGSGVNLSQNQFYINPFGYPIYKNRQIVGGPGSNYNFIEGFGANAYKGWQIDVDFIIPFSRRDLNPYLASCFLSDDIVISFILSYLNVNLIGLPRQKSFYEIHGLELIETLPHNYDKDALSYLVTSGKKVEFWTHPIKYRECHQQLIEFFLDFEKDNVPFRSREDVLNKVLSSFS